jgi:hypothetical protein
VALQQAPNDCSERNSGEASQASVCGDCICPFNPALSRHVRGKLGVRVCVHSTLIHTRVRFLLSRGGGAAKAETLCSTARSCSRPPHRHEACKAKSSGWSLWVKVALLRSHLALELAQVPVLALAVSALIAASQS